VPISSAEAARFAPGRWICSIAATAIEHELTLVTRNVADYGDVPGLRLLTPPGSTSVTT